MDEAPNIRVSLLIRLRDPGDERAWSEFAEIDGPQSERREHGRAQGFGQGREAPLSSARANSRCPTSS
jgi:hypothetical protein